MGKRIPSLSFDEAVELYVKHCESNGLIPMIPANTSFPSKSGAWHLVNCNGRLARVFYNGHVELG